MYYLCSVAVYTYTLQVHKQKRAFCLLLLDHLFSKSDLSNILLVLIFLFPFQARIAFLQGERKGQENLKNDLVRRIKMLEYALKQERAKYSKLKYGSDAGNATDSTKPQLEEDGLELPPLDGENYIAVSNVNWRQGRQLLRQ